jgi:hypothetical protein
MPNGKPGDHPYTDIVVHGKSRFNPETIELAKELHDLNPDSFFEIDWQTLADESLLVDRLKKLIELNK